MILNQIGLAPLVRTGPVADNLHTASNFLKSDAGQGTVNLALTAGLACVTGIDHLQPVWS